MAVELQAKRDKVVSLLTEAGLHAIVPQGGYFILADVRDIMAKVDVGGDKSESKDFRFVKWLSRNRKLQGIPPSAFFSQAHKSIGEDYIRFCFIKVNTLRFCLLTRSYFEILSQSICIAFYLIECFFLLQEDENLEQAGKILKQLKLDIDAGKV